LEEIDKEYATLVASISDDGLRIAKNRQDYRAERSSFHKAMEAILVENDQGEQLYHYFDKDDSWGEALRQILKKADNSDYLIQMTLEALPHLDMPHEHKLPSFPEIQQRIQEVMAELQQFKSRPPFVTIARSTNDGFCPASLVEQIEEDLLQRLHEHYCGCNGKICCTLRVVNDYGNWEGSNVRGLIANQQWFLVSQHNTVVLVHCSTGVLIGRKRLPLHATKLARKKISNLDFVAVICHGLLSNHDHGSL
jgi:hypothetical protein